MAFLFFVSSLYQFPFTFKDTNLLHSQIDYDHFSTFYLSYGEFAACANVSAEH